jgi:hypothetical protein
VHNAIVRVGPPLSASLASRGRANIPTQVVSVLGQRRLWPPSMMFPRQFPPGWFLLRIVFVIVNGAPPLMLATPPPLPVLPLFREKVQLMIALVLVSLWKWIAPPSPLPQVLPTKVLLVTVNVALMADGPLPKGVFSIAPPFKPEFFKKVLPVTVKPPALKIAPPRPRPAPGPAWLPEKLLLTTATPSLASVTRGFKFAMAAPLASLRLLKKMLLVMFCVLFAAPLFEMAPPPLNDWIPMDRLREKGAVRDRYGTHVVEDGTTPQGIRRVFGDLVA